MERAAPVVVVGTVVEAAQPPKAADADVGSSYPPLIEMVEKFKAEFGAEGSTIEVVDAAALELSIDGAHLSLVLLAHPSASTWVAEFACQLIKCMRASVCFASPDSLPRLESVSTGCLQHDAVKKAQCKRDNMMP